MPAASQPISVVTGGAGFLGSYLTDRLLAEGHKVIAIDNLITGNLANIEHLSGNENYRFVRHNVSDFILLPEEKLDYVFHFASPASPIDYLELPIPTLKVGALGTHNTLGLAKAKGAAYLLASTSECYGDPLVHPQNEDYWGNVNPVGPRGVYDEAKRFAEAITMAYHRTHKVETRIVRIFNTYGPRMRLNDGRVVPNFISQALKNEPMTVYGDGSQSRCFGFVKDVVKALVALMDRPEAVGEIYNIGASTEISILDLARRVKEITKSASPIVLIPYDDAYEAGYQDMPRRIPDTSKLRNLVGFAPTTDIDEIVDSVMKSFLARQERSAQRPQISLRHPVRVA